MNNHTISITSANEQSSTIYIKNGCLEDIGTLIDIKKYSRVFILTDKNIPKSYINLLQNACDQSATIYTIPGGEFQKNLKTAETIWTALHTAKCDRKSLMINIGGGVITDIGGFCAATYMRGIDYINIPTTLLSQVDASVGGKNGLNFDGIKNLIGTITLPFAVIIDPLTLSSLPDRQFTSGFAEIIKHGLVWDKPYFNRVTAKKPRSYTAQELEEIICRSCQIKNEIIADDITEQNKRKIVNFGHTVGHALEIYSLGTNQPLLHGEAVSIGMMAEARISEAIGMLSKEEVQTITQKLANADLPTGYRGASVDQLLELMKSDKKNENQQLQFTLLTAIGEAVINQAVPKQVLVNALAELEKA